MTLNGITKAVKSNSSFLDFHLFENVLFKESQDDIIVGFLFEKTTECLYIWKYIQPLIFDIEYKSLIFSHRIKIPGSIVLKEFNIENTINEMSKVKHDFPINIQELVSKIDINSSITYEQKSDYFWMKIYLNTMDNKIDSDLDIKLIEHLSLHLNYDYQVLNLKIAQNLISLNITDRKSHFSGILKINNQRFKIKNK